MKYDLVFDPPVMNAAGSLGFTAELHRSIDWSGMGAFVTNPVSLHARRPAESACCLDYPGGFLLHTGFPNSGIRAVRERYAPHWANAPLQVIVHLLCGTPQEVGQMVRLLEDLPGAAAAMQRYTERCRAAGYRFRPLDTGAFDAELGLLHELSAEVFAGNVLASPIEREEFLTLYRPARPLVRPELALFAHAPDGRPAGFLFSYLDPVPGTLDVKSVGCLPSTRGRGLGPALVQQAYAAGARLGLTRANLCLIHEDNVSGRLDGGLGRVCRNYHLYERKL